MTQTINLNNEFTVIIEEIKASELKKYKYKVVEKYKLKILDIVNEEIPLDRTAFFTIAGARSEAIDVICKIKEKELRSQFSVQCILNSVK